LDTLHYRLAVESNHANAQNDSGNYVERGLGVQANIELARECCKRSTKQGYSNGVNNLDFCLEHGQDVEQDIKLAA
jgi:TPR repeat protein